MTNALLVLKELESGKTFDVAATCIIGRSPQADLVLTDPSISKRHARITEFDNNFFIEDLQSSNGVYINQRRTAESVEIKEGDMIQLGRVKLLVAQKQIAGEESEQTVVLKSLSMKTEWQIDHNRLKLIHEITSELISNPDMKILTEKVFLKLRPLFNQDRGYLALIKENGTLEPLFSEPSLQNIPMSRSLLDRVFRSGESLLLEDALSDADLKWQESILGLRIRSALCVPLIFHQQIYGLIYVDNNTPSRYNEADLEFLRTIAFILGPMLENARLWSELKKRHEDTLEDLKKTQAQLIDAERKAAYIHLAQAMAHEIRNPLMAAGGLLARMARSASEHAESPQYQSVLGLLERIELILKEVDSFVHLPEPRKELVRIDQMLQTAIAEFVDNWNEKGLIPFITVNTPHLMAPIDDLLFKKALCMILREIQQNLPDGSKFQITVNDSGEDLEILFGEATAGASFYEPLDPMLKNKPRSSGLFLYIAYKIISDHGGTILLDPKSISAFPIIIEIPKSIQI